jgi:hypothetical protein
MAESEVAERIAARRAELDGLEEQLVKQLEEVRAERDELAVAERAWQRMAGQLAEEAQAAAPPAVQVASQAVLLVPHRGPGMDQDVLPPHYRDMLAAVQGAGGPVSAKQVGQELGPDTVTPGKLEPLRGKLSKLAGRGWLRKLPDGRFTARP